METFAIGITFLLICMFILIGLLMTGKIKSGQDYYSYWQMQKDGVIKPIYTVFAANQAYMDGLKLWFGMLQYPEGFKEWDRDKQILWRHYRREQHRVFGFFYNLHEAREAVMRNCCDLHECCYTYICIDKIYEGIHGGSMPEDQEWYKYEPKTETWYRIDQPEETKRICNFGLG